jgi:hypothetical protein
MKKIARQRSSARRSHQDAQRRYRDQDKERHICQVNVRVPERWSADVQKFAQLMREGATPEAAFRKALPRRATTVNSQSLATSNGGDRRNSRQGVIVTTD